ncbi:uracil-DNA glycosylase [Candidatus Magnetomorum sp. HK-1]|nr:uracil-DNA glycosylase [Candidatus Magnetomorum sp. HK-1]
MKTKRIDCHKCRHYFVTWNRKFPHGCRFMGFKCRFLPSLEVKRISGSSCMIYEEKMKKVT